MAIQTNISLTQTQKEYYQKFVNLSVNEKALPQGDGTIRISPFDDYFLFTVFDEVDGEDTPIDLSNVGDIFISFIGLSDEISIKNHTQVEDIDLSKGEVLFRITKSDSKKVLALDNNNFYISTKMVDENSISDESILYQGTWLAFDDANRITLTSQIEEQRLEYGIQLAKLKEENVILKANNTALVTSAEKDTLTIQALTASNNELVDEVSTLSSNLSSAALIKINTNAKEAQAMADKQLVEKQQIRAIHEVSQTGTKKKGSVEQAAKNLQQFKL